MTDETPSPAPESFDGEPIPPREHYAICPQPVPAGADPCFVTDNWPTQEAADKRLTEHLAEHHSGNPAPELAESAARTGSPLDAQTRKHARAALQRR